MREILSYSWSDIMSDAETCLETGHLTRPAGFALEVSSDRLEGAILQLCRPQNWQSCRWDVIRLVVAYKRVAMDVICSHYFSTYGMFNSNSTCSSSCQHGCRCSNMFCCLNSIVVSIPLSSAAIKFPPPLGCDEKSPQQDSGSTPSSINIHLG